MTIHRLIAITLLAAACIALFLTNLDLIGDHDE
jgi:hypothetical protein